ncbi:MAG: secondary thiamine-phosphate synthase enzyme YjbQ [Rhodothermia bacterium]|nr:MAG: secondary thiamine-phosphate synthase enzyme YjbQ [Rhodothermia bacterium]
MRIYLDTAMTHQDQFQLSTSGHRDMHDVTQTVATIVANSGVGIGTAHIHVIGSTGAVGTIEFEPGLRRDLPELFDQLMPPSREYGHEQAWHDGNAHSHLQATTLGPSLNVPISDGKLILGTWQQIFFLECDVRPRSRTLVVTVMGDE